MYSTWYFASAWAAGKRQILAVFESFCAQQVRHQRDSGQTAEGGEPRWPSHSIKFVRLGWQASNLHWWLHIKQ